MSNSEFDSLVRRLRKAIAKHDLDWVLDAVEEVAKPAKPTRRRGRPRRYNPERNAWVLHQVQLTAREHGLSEAKAIKKIAPLLVPPVWLLDTGGLGDMVVPGKRGERPEGATHLNEEAIKAAVKQAKRSIRDSGKK